MNNQSPNSHSPNGPETAGTPETVTFTPEIGQVRLGVAGQPGSAGGDAASSSAGRRKRRKGRRDDVMVPDAQFSSYYGRQIVKPAPWSYEIPAYLYLGGLAAGSGLLSAGASFTNRPQLRRSTRLIAMGALGGSTVALISDLGKPSRFLNMMRTVKVTSPMSLGSWILAGYGTFAGASTATEAVRLVTKPGSWPYKLVEVLDKPASVGTALFAPLLAAYTAVLLADTATPTWHESYRELPFVFVGSALAASGGAAMIATSVDEAGPARRLAVAGSVLDVAAHHLLERRLGVLAEPLHEGRPGVWTKAAQALMVAGTALTLVGGKRRAVAAAAGLALNAGSAFTRFAVFYAGIASAKDPKYTVIPQRARLEARRAASTGGDPHGITTP